MVDKPAESDDCNWVRFAKNTFARGELDQPPLEMGYPAGK